MDEPARPNGLSRVGDCHGDFKSLSGFVVEMHSPRPTCQEVLLECERVLVTDGCEKHLCLRGSRFANQVIHQGDGPKLPYQAVVIRQSAIYRKGRNAVDTAGGVVSHTGSGPVPTLFSSVTFKRARTAGSKSPIALAPRRRSARSCNTPATILAS